MGVRGGSANTKCSASNRASGLVVDVGRPPADGNSPARRTAEWNARRLPGIYWIAVDLNPVCGEVLCGTHPDPERPLLGVQASHTNGGGMWLEQDRKAGSHNTTTQNRDFPSAVRERGSGVHRGSDCAFARGPRGVGWGQPGG